MYRPTNTMIQTLAAAGITAMTLAFASAAAQAGVIFDNGSPDGVEAYHSDFDQSFMTTTVQLADDFSLASAETLTDVHWSGIYASDNSPPALDDFTIRIFANVSGNAPATNPLHDFHVGHVGRTDSGDDIGSFDLYDYWVFVPATSLTAGTYWLSIVNDTANEVDDWFWATSAQTGNTHDRDADGTAWTPNGDQIELAFRLTDDEVPVPEPGTLALFGLGLAGLGFVRRRRTA